MITWHHIMDKQPEDKTVIIQCFPAEEEQYKDCDFNKHYTMGMIVNRNYQSWSEYMDYCEKHDCYPNYWWCYAKDFPFPAFKNEFKSKCRYCGIIS